MQLNHNGEEYISYPKYINKDELINKLNEIYSDKNYYISDSVDLINNLTYIYQNYINIFDYNILDIGCNIGTYSFLSYFNNAKYVEGIDFNCDFINIANETKSKLNINDTSIKFINSDIFDINFKTKNYDVVLYFNNIFWDSEFDKFDYNLKIHKLFNSLIRYNKYFILGANFDSTIEYFNNILTKHKYTKYYIYKDMIVYKNNRGV